MRILHLAFSDTAGVPGRWAQAHREAGLEVELVIERRDEYRYGAVAERIRWSAGNRSMQWKLGVLEEFVERADALMVYDHPLYLVAALRTGKPVLFRAFGTQTRRNVGRVRALLTHPKVVRATAGTGDLALALGVELAGCPFPRLGYSSKLGRDGIATHSPSDRGLKGTETILRVARLAGWEVDVVEDTTHAEVLRRKRRSTLVIDQFGEPPHPDGIGVSAIEGMAMGLPVIGRATPDVAALYRELECPVILVDSEEELHQELRWLRYRKGERERLGSLGRAWVSDFHDGSRRAAEDMAALGVAT